MPLIAGNLPTFHNFIPYSGSSVTLNRGDFVIRENHVIFNVEDLISEYGSDEMSVLLKNENDFNILCSIYDVNNKNEVKKYLSSNNYLIKLLFDANYHINSIFGRNINKLLEVDVDPEEGFEELFIIIKSHYSASEGLKLMHRLEGEWLIDIMDEVQDKLNIIEEPL